MERSFPFDGGEGSIVTEADWSNMAKNWLSNGVIDNSANFSVGTSLRVSATGPNTLTLSPGAYWLDGFYYVNDANLDLTFSTNSSSYNRSDIVILRLDKNANSVQAAILEGTPGTPTFPPSLEDSDSVTEVPLCYYTVAAGQSVATNLDQTHMTPTGRRIEVVKDQQDIPWGGIGYFVGDDKFYARNKNGVLQELGASSGSGSGSGLGENERAVVVGSSRPASANNYTFFYTTTSRTLSVYDGSAWRDLGTAGAAPVTKSLGIDDTITADNSLMMFPLWGGAPEAGTYLFEGTIYYWCDTPGSTLRLTWNPSKVSSSPTPKINCKYRPNLVDANGVPLLSVTTNSTGLNVFMGAYFSNQYFECEFQAVVYITGANGYLIPVLTGQNSGTWTISSASWGRLTRLY